MRFTHLLLIVFFLICGNQLCFGQESVSLSLFPGYHIINTDRISKSDQISKTEWIFGGMISSDIHIKNLPLEMSIGYSQGESNILTTRLFIGNRDVWNYVNLRYQNIPVEALIIHPLNNMVKFLAGINISAQQRTLYFTESNNKDRLLSFGFGLTTKIQTNFMEIRNTNASIFANLTARWTEYLIHDANGRNLDNFTLRHITLAPQFGFRWNLTQQNSLK